MSGLDFNDAAPQRENDLIPPCIARVHTRIRPGDQNGPGQHDLNVLTSSKSSDALMLSFEFTVVSGPNANRKFFQNMVVSGGKVDDKGVSKAWNMTKSSLRAMLESAFGVMPKDESPDAKAKRTPPGFQAFDNLEFVAKIGIEPGQDNKDKPGEKYADKNVLDLIITPDMKDYTAAMAGETIPVAAKASTATAAPSTAAAKPAWAAPGAAAASTTAPAAAVPPAAQQGSAGAASAKPAWLA